MASHIRLILRATRPPIFRPKQRQCSLTYHFPSTSRLYSSASGAPTDEYVPEDAAVEEEDADGLLEPEPEPQSAYSPDPEDVDANIPAQTPRSAKVDSHSQFLTGLGHRLKYAEPRLWLTHPDILPASRSSSGPRAAAGPKGPFPMNPSFVPPAPLSDAHREAMYREFMFNPKENSLRVLSQKYSVSMKRVDAILRLKGLEADWKRQDVPLQTGFHVGMERLLGVKQPTLPAELTESQKERTDADEADTLEELENRDAARQRYQRLYWEAVPEDGSEPVTPQSIEQAKAHAVLISKIQQAKLMKLPIYKDTEFIKTPRKRVRVVEKPGRPPVMFVDVGAKFMDKEVEAKRQASAERRKRANSKPS